MSCESTESPRRRVCAVHTCLQLIGWEQTATPSFGHASLEATSQWLSISLEKAGIDTFALEKEWDDMVEYRLIWHKIARVFRGSCLTVGYVQNYTIYIRTPILYRNRSDFAYPHAKSLLYIMGEHVLFSVPLCYGVFP